MYFAVGRYRMLTSTYLRYSLLTADGKCRCRGQMVLVFRYSTPERKIFCERGPILS